MTITVLRDALRYNPVTGIISWRVSLGTARAGAEAGCVDGAYRRVKIDGVMYFSHRLAWLLMTGGWPEDQIDHINGDGLDNRWCNLRAATREINAQNIRTAKQCNRSGVLGANSNGSGFRARIRINGRQVQIGNYRTAEEAHRAYVQFKREYHPGCTI